MLCPKCGADPGEKRFCGDCGSPIREPTTAAFEEKKIEDDPGKQMLALAIVVGGILLIFSVIWTFSSSGDGRKEAEIASPSPKEAAEPQLTDDQKFERGCRALRSRLRERKLSDLTVKEVEMMNLCRAVGY